MKHESSKCEDSEELSDVGAETCVDEPKKCCGGSCSQKQEEAVKAAEPVVEDWKDKYLRALAEIENSRKRLMREKAESQGLAIQNVIVDLLQPFDQLELALRHADKAPSEVKAWAMGFQMILDHFRQVFSSYDVHAFSGLGKLFDPHLHEAIEMEENDAVADGTIVQEFQTGYRMGAKTIRPAKVKVSTFAKKEEKSE